MLSELQKKAAQAIVNIFETGRIQGEYGQVTLLRNDSGHLTYGRAQTTLASGNLYLLLKAYTERPEAQYAQQLRPYLERLEERDLRLDHDMSLRNLLREAGDDPVMHTTQDQFFDQVYWAPSARATAALSITSALGAAVVYDSHIHGSWQRLRDRTTANHGTPASIGERAWVGHYVAERRQWLGTHANTLLHRTVYRMDTFRQLMADDNWELRLPFQVRSLTVTAASLEATASAPATPSTAPARLLRLRTPFLQGEDVRGLQQALNTRGFTLNADGIFGNDTDQAVKQFQEQQGLTADGIVGPATRAAMERGETPVRAAAHEEGEVLRLLRVRTPFLQGDDVRAVQQALSQAGYSVQVDGVFGTATEQAVQQFQAHEGLSADGIVGPATREALGL